MLVQLVVSCIVATEGMRSSRRPVAGRASQGERMRLLDPILETGNPFTASDNLPHGALNQLKVTSSEPARHKERCIQEQKTWVQHHLHTKMSTILSAMGTTPTAPGWSPASRSPAPCVAPPSAVEDKRLAASGSAPLPSFHKVVHCFSSSSGCDRRAQLSQTTNSEKRDSSGAESGRLSCMKGTWTPRWSPVNVDFDPTQAAFCHCGC